MVVIRINGVSVDFPYEPYNIQINYMERVISALQLKQNALLESPTGTGKTLCLLCASLAWLDYEKVRQRLPGESIPPLLVENVFDGGSKTKEASSFENQPRIIYASRTHSQLAQVMQELRKTPYGKMNRVAVLGSREQMCIHPQVSAISNMAAKNKVCRTKVRTHSCAFYQKLEETKESCLASTPLADIEELISYGQKHRVCPYYLSKASEKNADIMFLPYNYVFDPSVRRTMKLDLDGAIVILDEGHNVGKVCEDSYSYEISSVDLATCISEVKRILKELVQSSGPVVAVSQSVGPTKNLLTENHENGVSDKVRSVAELQKTLLAFESAFEDVNLSEDSNAGIVNLMSFLRNLFEKARVNKTTFTPLMDVMRALLMETENSDNSSSISAHNIGVLQKFQDLMDMAFSEETTRYHNFFRVYMRKDDIRRRLRDGWSGDGIQTKQSRILSVWCLSPGCTMKTLVSNGIHSIIITSGTLSPVDPLLQEMGIPFPVQLFNPHIVKSNQVWVGVCSKGPDGIEWTSQYKNKDSIEYRRSLGRGMSNFFEVIPDGILIFFSSYRAMTDCIETWKNCELWENLNRRKTCFVEPSNRTEFTQMLVEYFKLARQEGKGAAFFGVCRGKISEGVDFPDDCARAVIITGLPYPNKMEPKIRVKMEYLQQTFGSIQTRTLSSSDWYNREAWSAVNQALGRVIRHANDFGACVLCDCRFDSEQSKKQLSGWLRNYLKSFSVPMAKRSLCEFFRSHSTAPKPNILPTAIVKQLDDFAWSAPVSLNVDETSIDLPICSQPAASFALDFDSKSVRVGQVLPPAKRKSVFEAMSVISSQLSLQSVELVKPPPKTAIDSTGEASLAASRFAKKKLVVKPVVFSQPEIPRSTDKVGNPKIRIKSSQESCSISNPKQIDSSVSKNSTAVNSCDSRRISIQDVILRMKGDLDQMRYKDICLSLNLMRDPMAMSCSALIASLKAISDSEKQKKISDLLSRFVPPRFRVEYDLFLNEIGALVILD